MELTIHCLLPMQGLQCHLNSSHDLFAFEFKVFLFGISCFAMHFNEIIVKKSLSYCSFRKNTRQLMFL